MPDRKDRRVLKTREAIRRGLIRLMKTKSIKEITVKELTELVDINRATFYNHYKDIYDLFESIEDDMYEEFEQTLNKYPLSRQISQDSRPAPPIRASMSLFLEIFQFLAYNSEICLFLLSDKGDNEFIQKLVNGGRNKYIQDWKKTYRIENNELTEATYSFVASGCIGLIRYWLEGGMKQPPAEMAAIAEKLILHSMKALDIR